MSKLAQLAEMSTVVADTGDIDAIAKLKPVDGGHQRVFLWLHVSRRFCAFWTLLRNLHEYTWNSVKQATRHERAEEKPG